MCTIYRRGTSSQANDYRLLITNYYSDMKENIKFVMMLVAALACGWGAMASIEYGWPESATLGCVLGAVVSGMWLGKKCDASDAAKQRRMGQ